MEVILPEVEMAEEERFPDQLRDDQHQTGQHDAAAAGPRRELCPVDHGDDLAAARAVP
jgi:hypothetical protein